MQVATAEMAYGPHAVGRVDGKVVFVRGGAPDELAEVRIREVHARFAFADLETVLRPSPARRAAPCAYLPRCGGCPWQHLEYGAQLAAKAAVVREHLRRIAGIDAAVLPPLPSPQTFGYRRRIKLRVDGDAVGFHAAASHAVVPIDHCLLAEAPLDAAIPAAQQLAARLESALRRVELVAVGGTAARVVVAGEVSGAFAASDDARIEAWMRAHAPVAGVVLRGRGWRREWGDLRTHLSGDPGHELVVRAPAFTQVNGEANRLLVATVLRAAECEPGWSVLDLYAGAGNFSLPLRRRGARVTAVEDDRAAAADAQQGAAQEPGPPLRVIGERAESTLRRLAAAGERFDLVVLDPPRSGAAGCVPALLEMRPPRIVYVSCDPATLARDLQRLHPAYRLDWVQPIDMFPHTYHVETVVRLLACGPPEGSVSSARRSATTSPPRRRRARLRRA